MNLLYHVLEMFLFCCCLVPCIAINNVVSVQRFLPVIILWTQCYYHRGTRLNAIKRFCLCSLWSHLNVLTFSPLTGGCSEGLDAFRIFFKHDKRLVACPRVMPSKVCSAGRPWLLRLRGGILVDCGSWLSQPRYYGRVFFKYYLSFL